ncbi:MAG: beta-lactamase family protein [Chloroflexi bacterium]|nr:beta-lactamase family protein [Chloroflexota bacterium]
MDPGPEIGLQVAAYLDGELVVDTWAGVADAASGRRVDGDTIFMVSATAQGVVATLMHLLAERGRLDYDAPVVCYWPEFGANGKADVLVRHVLAHTAGVPRVDQQTPELLLDWDAMCAAIAALPPMYPPGAHQAYHMFTFGYICGELIRRIDGRSVNAFLQDELCRSLEIEGLYFGVPDDQASRVATLADSPDQRGAYGAAFFNRPEVVRASIPSMGGFATARAMARHYAMLANGGALDGVRLLSPQRLRVAAEVHAPPMDALYAMYGKRGLGYRLEEDAGPGAGPHAFGHIGGGASFAYADPDRHFAVALTKNYLLPPARVVDRYQPPEVCREAYDAVREALGLT